MKNALLLLCYPNKDFPLLKCFGSNNGLSRGGSFGVLVTVVEITAVQMRRAFVDDSRPFEVWRVGRSKDIVTLYPLTTLEALRHVHDVEGAELVPQLLDERLRLALNFVTPSVNDGKAVAPVPITATLLFDLFIPVHPPILLPDRYLSSSENRAAETSDFDRKNGREGRVSDFELNFRFLIFYQRHHLPSLFVYGSTGIIHLSVRSSRRSKYVSLLLLLRIQIPRRARQQCPTLTQKGRLSR